MKHLFKNITGGINSIVEALLRNCPTSLGFTFRNSYWKGKLRKYSGPVTLGMGVAVRGAGNIELGEHVTVMERSYLYAHNNGSIKIGNWFTANTNVQIGAADRGSIIIGNDVIIGPNVVLRASNHVYQRTDIPIRKQGHTGGSIDIEDDVWIAANAVILPNTKIAKGAIVAAGAVVTKDIPAYSVVGGVPAHVIGTRGSNNLQRKTPA